MERMYTGDEASRGDSPPIPFVPGVTDAKWRPKLQGIHVLVVEDEPDARAMLQLLLEQCGATVRTANSARSALALVQDEKPDVIVSDISMPGEDGHSMMRRLRAAEPQVGRIPAVALTANSRSEDRVEAIRAGFQIHIPKPVETDELLTIVASLAGRL